MPRKARSSLSAAPGERRPAGQADETGDDQQRDGDLRPELAALQSKPQSRDHECHDGREEQHDQRLPKASDDVPHRGTVVAARSERRSPEPGCPRGRDDREDSLCLSGPFGDTVISRGKVAEPHHVVSADIQASSLRRGPPRAMLCETSSANGAKEVSDEAAPGRPPSGSFFPGTSCSQSAHESEEGPSKDGG